MPETEHQSRSCRNSKYCQHQEDLDAGYQQSIYREIKQIADQKVKNLRCGGDVSWVG